MAIAGIAAFAVALEAVVHVVMSYVVSRTAGIAAAAAFAVAAGLLWYGLPLWAAARDRRAR